MAGLADVAEAAEPEHPGLKTVKHGKDTAYALVAVPDSLAPAMMCEKESHQHPYAGEDPATLKYGNYYDMVFELKTPGEHPASLSFLWGKDNGKWKIISYEMMSP